MKQNDLRSELDEIRTGDLVRSQARPASAWSKGVVSHVSMMNLIILVLMKMISFDLRTLFRSQISTCKIKPVNKICLSDN